MAKNTAVIASPDLASRLCKYIGFSHDADHASEHDVVMVSMTPGEHDIEEMRKLTGSEVPIVVFDNQDGIIMPKDISSQKYRPVQLSCDWEEDPKVHQAVEHLSNTFRGLDEVLSRVGRGQTGAVHLDECAFADEKAA